MMIPAVLVVLSLVTMKVNSQGGNGQQPATETSFCKPSDVQTYQGYIDLYCGAIPEYLCRKYEDCMDGFGHLSKNNFTFCLDKFGKKPYSCNVISDLTCNNDPVWPDIYCCITERDAKKVLGVPNPAVRTSIYTQCALTVLPGPLCTLKQAADYTTMIANYCDSFSQEKASKLTTCYQEKGHISQEARKYCGDSIGKDLSDPLSFVKFVCSNDPKVNQFLCCTAYKDNDIDQNTKWYYNSKRKEVYQECLNKATG